MRLGLTLPVRGLSPDAMLNLACHARDHGCHEIWAGEVNGIDAIPLMAALAREPELWFGTGIMSVYRWTPIGMASTACAMHDLSGGRFSLGIGSSSARMVDAWTGTKRVRPFERLRAYVELLRAVFSGNTGSVDLQSLNVRKLAVVPEAQRDIPILLAAMGAKSIELSAEVADGSVLNMLSHDALADVISRLQHHNPHHQTVFRVLAPAEETTESITQMGRHLSTYGRIPVYASSFVEQELAVPDSADANGIEALVRELVLMPSDDAITENVRKWRSSGLSTLVLAVSSTFADEEQRLASMKALIERVAAAVAEFDAEGSVARVQR